ncbi:MAG TPA: hypothetical protein GX497_01455 [Bacillus bacterium]|nr:hypothetical protein [Bacillus sp. (in: firmicutes)]
MFTIKLKFFLLSVLLVVSILVPNVYADNLKQRQLEFVIKLNDKVHHMLIYGPGLDGDESAQELLDYGEGHCGDFNYLLIRDLLMNGFEARSVGIDSGYNNASHSRVEVKIGGSWYTFDPTYNTYFPHSTEDMISNPELISDMVGVPNEHSFYNDIEFFKSPQKIYYEYNMDYRDRNLVKESKISSTTSFYDGYGVDQLADGIYDTYTGAQSYQLPQSLNIDFGKPQDFYRIKIKWYTPQTSGTSFLIEYMDENSKYKELIREIDYKDPENDGVYEKVLSKPVTSKNVRFTLFDANKEKRILIREFMIFQ